MFLENLSRREKMLLYISAAIISLSLTFNFVFKPASVKWRRLNRQIINKEIELKRNIKYIRQKKEIASIYQRYTGYIKRAGTNETEMSALLNDVEKVASTSGIHIANIRPKPAKDLQFFRKYILELNCEATMSDYIGFIYNLQTSGQLIRVEQLKLTSQGKNSSLLRARMIITKVLASK
jgi:Tfp pilus assembly protein PilO